MSEQDLIDLGFEKIEHNDEVSKYSKLEHDEKFHYYSYDIKGKPGAGSLISDSDDELRDRNEVDWKVYAWDINENLVFDNPQDIKTYIDVIEGNIK